MKTFAGALFALLLGTVSMFGSTAEAAYYHHAYYHHYAPHHYYHHVHYSHHG